MFAFLYVKANSKEVCEEISFPSFSRKILISAFLMRFKANNLEKMRGYPNFSLRIPIALGEIYFFRVVLTWRKNLWHRHKKRKFVNDSGVDITFSRYGLSETERETELLRTRVN